MANTGYVKDSEMDADEVVAGTGMVGALQVVIEVTDNVLKCAQQYILNIY